MDELNRPELSPEYRMGYMNSILLYYVLKILDTSKDKTLHDEIYEYAKQMAFGDVLKEIDKHDKTNS